MLAEKEELDWIFIETSTAIIMDKFEQEDVDLVKTSWTPARRDTKAAGLLLFKGLFTKFPDYLKLFPQFGSLDLERMGENRRLVHHATKVIDTVTFVVDCIGDDDKSNELSDALLAMVRSHLKRSIGLEAFRNLGIVLLDFICALNHSYQGSLNSKLRQNASTIRGNRTENNNTVNCFDMHSSLTSSCSGADNDERHQQQHQLSDDDEDIEIISLSKDGADRSFDTNAVVAAWTKLYSNILELVKSEESLLAANAKQNA